MDGIPWHDLSKTVQDAMRITFAMDIHFIWVDSLCIIQDDDQDWEREVSQWQISLMAA
jgi:hypothetical protein